MPKKKYEIFMSFKDKDKNGNRTESSRLAEDIFTTLTTRGYRVFFSREALPGMVGGEYEPVINAALKSARLLVLVFSNAEEVNSEWVKHEWMTFSTNRKPILTVYKGCGDADLENMPYIFKKLQYCDLTEDSKRQYEFMLKKIDEIMRRGKFFFGKRHPRPKKNSSHSPLPAPKKIPQERGKRSESSSSYALEKETREKKQQDEVGAGDLLALISQLENRKNKKDGALTNKYAKESVNSYTDSSLDKPTGISLHIKPAKLVEKFMRFMDFDDWLIKFMKAETNIIIIHFILAVVFNHDGDLMKITSLELIQSSINNSTSIVESTYVDAFYDFSMIGNKMMFGQYPQGANGEIKPLEWRVLEVRDGKALLITDKLIDVIPFNIEFTDITWETCTLRKWLNNEFVNKAFSTSQQAQIETVLNLTPDSTLWGSEGGNPTEDKVFVLSIDEAENYFHNDHDRMSDLELIPKLILMNRKELAPNDDGTSKMNESKIVVSLLFIAHEKFSKAVHMGMKYLDNPSAGLKVWILFLLFFLFPARNNVGYIVAIGDGFLLSCIASIKAKILRMFLCYFRTSNHYIIERIFQ